METKIYWVLFFIIFIFSNVEAQTYNKALELTRMKYNNPGLVVDLGVGLWAWPLPMDYDKDGDMDLIVSCPDKPFNGLYFFENISGNVRAPLFEKPIRLAAARKNIQVCHLEGDTHVLGPGEVYNDFRGHLFDQPQSIFNAELLENKHQKIRFSLWKYVDYEGDGDLDLIVGIDDWGDYGWDNAYNNLGEWTNGPLHGYVYLLENDEGHYQDRGKIMAGERPVDVYGAPTPNMDDFDGDGDLDLICGEFLDRFTWFENVGSRKDPIYAEGRFLENKEGLLKMDLEMITPSAVDWEGDGDIDLIVGDEDGRVALLENTGIVKNHMPIFNPPYYLQQKADEVKFGALVTPFSVDWDDDGDEDLVCGNTAGYIGFIENIDGNNPPAWNAPQRLTADGSVIRIMAGENGSIQGPAEQKWGYTTLSVADWDHDGRKDIIINSIWGKVEWYRNIGEQGHPRLTAMGPLKVKWNSEPPKPEWTWWTPASQMLATQWRTTPVVIDWNKDGLVDLIMLDHEGYLAFYERTNINGNYFLLPGKRIFYGIDGCQFNNRSELQNSETGPLLLNSAKYGSSGRRKWCFMDWDKDGDLDIMINSINIAWLENVGQTSDRVNFQFRGNLSDHLLAGHTTSPTPINWSKSGLLVGAEDGYLYLMEKD